MSDEKTDVTRLDFEIEEGCHECTTEEGNSISIYPSGNTVAMDSGEYTLEEIIQIKLRMEAVVRSQAD